MGSRQRWIRLLAPIVAVLLIGEFAVRAAEDRLPERFEFQSAEVDLKVAQMDRLASQGGADVAVIGSSLATVGIQPEILSDTLGATVYNAGMAASSPILLESWLTGVVLPKLNPSTVVIGVTAYDFYDAPVAREFLAAFVDSPGGRRVTNSEGVFDRADRWMRDVSALWRNHQALRDPTVWTNAMFNGGNPQDRWIENYTADLGTAGAVRQSADIRLDAEEPTGGPNVSEWALGTDNPRALRDMIDAVVAQGATPVLVGMPVSEPFVERLPRADRSYDEFRRALHDLGTEKGVAVLDYDIHDIDYFADVVHLNGWGAAAFSEVLAADLADRLSTDAGEDDDIAGGPDDVDSGDPDPRPGEPDGDRDAVVPTTLPDVPDVPNPTTTAPVPPPPPLTLPELELPEPDPPTGPTLPPDLTIPPPTVTEPPLDIPTDP